MLLVETSVTSGQAFDLSTHSMETTSLAAAGQLNLNLDSPAKQGCRKRSSSGWRPLERGAKQSFREPIFFSPPITPSDLQLVQLPLPKNQPILDSHSTKSQIPFTPGFDRSSDRIQSGTTAGDSSLMVMNEKSHQGRMLQRSCRYRDSNLRSLMWILRRGVDNSSVGPGATRFQIMSTEGVSCSSRS